MESEIIFSMKPPRFYDQFRICRHNTLALNVSEVSEELN